MGELISQESPNGGFGAWVEQDAATVYFYISSAEHPDRPSKACWVRNLGPAPEGLQLEEMREGTAPMLPRANCRHPQGAPELPLDELRIVWFEEGDGAALLDDKGPLAIIPAWAGIKDFNGYARDAVGECSLAWGADPDQMPELYARIQRADEFWNSWQSEESYPWPERQEAYLQAYEAVWGPHQDYYAIDQGSPLPKAMIRTVLEDGSVVFSTLGESLRPMPGVEMAVEDASSVRRVELALALGAGFDEEYQSAVAAYVASISDFPWHAGTWVGDGHTLQCDDFPLGEDGTMFAGVIFLEQLPDAPVIEFGSYRGDPINLLWLIPVTEDELIYARENGTQNLVSLLEAEGVTWRHEKSRQNVIAG